jgi:hypothetical protein
MTASEIDVVKRLTELCLRHPVECVSCLRLMIEGDKEGWILIGVEADARTLLKRALESNNPGCDETVAGAADESDASRAADSTH